MKCSNELEVKSDFADKFPEIYLTKNLHLAEMKKSLNFHSIYTY